MNHPPGKDLGQSPLRTTLFSVTSVALAYVVFYDLNAWLFSTFQVSENISWVFLPAAIRMIAVLLAGWAGVAGLFVGSIAVSASTLASDPLNALILATLSSVPSLYAAQAVQRLLGIPHDLRGMTWQHLLCFGVAGGLANSTVHTGYFILQAGSPVPLEGFIPMFVGDSVGTLLMLYAGALVLRRLRLPVR